LISNGKTPKTQTSFHKISKENNLVQSSKNLSRNVSEKPISIKSIFTKGISSRPCPELSILVQVCIPILIQLGVFLHG
jgi:hypothetical protein